MSSPRFFSPAQAACSLGAAAIAAAISLAACGGSGSTASTTTTTGSGGGDGGSASATTGSSGGAGPSSSVTTGAGGGLPGWTLVWSDEFNDADGSPPDPTKWSALVGGDGWGNQEREFYTEDTVNAAQGGGDLVITATTEGAAAHQCWYGACQYTSARLQTKAKFEPTYGRFEARILVPRGKGVWPAFWMLGADIDAVNWPQCGEIDVMENIGSEPNIVHASLHGPGYSGGQPLTAELALPGGAVLADKYHVFAVEWEKDAIRFYLDSTLYETRTPADIPAGTTWIFDHPFFVLLNVAVGGQLPGDPDATTSFPQSMRVDYVRAYARP